MWWGGGGDGTEDLGGEQGDSRDTGPAPSVPELRPYSKALEVSLTHEPPLLLFFQRYLQPLVVYQTYIDLKCIWKQVAPAEKSHVSSL